MIRRFIQAELKYSQQMMLKPSIVEEPETAFNKTVHQNIHFSCMEIVFPAFSQMQNFALWTYLV